jgi:trehalose 6-phosphate synthase
MSRLICVSNRIPRGPNPTGGLVVALADVLSQTGGLWVGSSGDIVETAEDTLEPIEGGPFRRLSFSLTEEEQAGYYAGFSNSVLWPILHGRPDVMQISGEHLSIYKAVNRRIARMLAPVIDPGDRIWVHDFHLLPLAYELRVLGVQNPIGFFLHTPFPGPFDMQALPNAIEMCNWIARYDLVGLQSRRDVRKFRSSLQALADAEPMGDNAMRLFGQQVQIGAYPISIDTTGFADLAERAFGKLPTGLVKPDRALMIGVDRLDYSKGLPQRFRAFGEFLLRHEDWHRHVSFLQISPPTREGLRAYDQIREETETLAGRINGAFADIDWQPLRYIHRSIPRETLAGLYRAAHVGLVTPLMDGMNLVAKEFVAAQNPADPGVLILSHFAGAAEQMEDALLVNPHDTEQVAATILTALTMGPAERRRRYERLMEGLVRHNVHRWARSFLQDLAQTAQIAPAA